MQPDFFKRRSMYDNIVDIIQILCNIFTLPRTDGLLLPIESR